MEAAGESSGESVGSTSASGSVLGSVGVGVMSLVVEMEVLIPASVDGVLCGRFGVAGGTVGLLFCLTW